LPEYFGIKTVQMFLPCYFTFAGLIIMAEFVKGEGVKTRSPSILCNGMIRTNDCVVQGRIGRSFREAFLSRSYFKMI